MILKIFTTIILIVCVSCDDDRHINSMIQKCVKLAIKKYNIDCIGSGVAAPDKIKKFMFSFGTNNSYNYQTARQLALELTIDLVAIANSDSIVLANLESNKFDHKNLYFALVFLDCNGDIEKEFSGITLSNGSFIFNTLDIHRNLKEIFSESYSESHQKAFGYYPPNSS